MNKLKLVFEQTMMVSFMVLCYISVLGLLAFRGTDTGFPWYIPGSIVLASFFCSLVTVFLLSDAGDNKDESPTKYYIKLIAHFILLYALIISVATFSHSSSLILSSASPIILSSCKKTSLVPTQVPA